jgi:tetratricopeptide (TPR) repeat protein
MNGIHRKLGHRAIRGPQHLATALIARLALALTLSALLLLPVAAAPVAAVSPGCTVQAGQALIEDGQYTKAIQAFTCVIDAAPTDVEGYRGRIEAEILLGRYSDAVIDYQRVMAFVVPLDPGAETTIIDGYAARLASNPTDVRALTGMSFAQWWFFHYGEAIQVTDQLLSAHPNDPFGTLFRGSARLLKGVTKAKGVVDLDRAIALAPTNPDVRVIVADAYTYGLPDPERAFAEASLALEWGLDTPRVHAILATSYTAFGDVEEAASHIHRSIELVTTEVVPTAPLDAGAVVSLDLVPGRVYAIPIAATQGESISIETSSETIWDSIAVLLAPDGTPVVGSDDTNAYMAAFDWVATESTTYTLLVTSFEAVSTGTLVVTS